MSGSPFASTRTVLARSSSLIGCDTQPLARRSPSVAGRDMALLADSFGRLCSSGEPRGVYVGNPGGFPAPVPAGSESEHRERLGATGVAGRHDPGIDVDRAADRVE